MSRRLRRVLSALPALVVCIGCAPRLRPLPGAPTTVSLPAARLGPARQLVVFRWELDDADLSARGEGAARIAPPDSVRLDFFLAGGMGSGVAILIGGDLRLPDRGEDIARRLVPPAPLLWASLGRLALPAAADTVVRVDGDTVRADIGRPIAWRVTFVRDTLRRVERVDGGRVVEWVDRSAESVAGGRIRYRHETSRRQLDLFIIRTAEVSEFDAAIWNIP